MPAVVNQEPSASTLSSQRRFRAYASPMHVGVQFSPSEKAGLEDQQEAYPDICFALDGAEALCSTVRPLSAGRLGCRRCANISGRRRSQRWSHHKGSAVPKVMPRRSVRAAPPSPPHGQR